MHPKMFKYIFIVIVIILNNAVLAKENIKKPEILEENEFTEINSAPLKVSEAARYSFADIVEPLIPAVVNISTIEYVNSKSENAEKDPLQEKKTFRLH